jgi:hypothetical protein
MIEETVLNYLSKKLSVPVSMEVPEKPPAAFCVVEKTGSGRDNRINSATFAVQSYGSTLYQAAELNERAKAAMDDLVELNEIARADLNSDYNFTDSSTKRYRYQAIYDITHY